MKPYIPAGISIDGRNIEYKIETAHDYLMLKEGWTEEQCDDFMDENEEQYTIINQIIGLKYSCYLLRNTSWVCQSLSDDLRSLKVRLIEELAEKFSYRFDDQFVEDYGFES